MISLKSSESKRFQLELDNRWITEKNFLNQFMNRAYLSLMDLLMLLKVAGRSERLLTLVALVWLHACVDAFMSDKVRCLRKIRQK